MSLPLASPTDSGESALARRLHELAPASLTLALCLWGLSRRQLWRDELATWWAASLSLSDLWRLVSGIDFVIGPYYLFMHAWIGLFGSSPFALRLPSVLAMVLATWFVTKLGRLFFDAHTGALAGLLFALVPSVSAYGQEARPYALAVACCAGATWQLVLLTQRPAHPDPAVPPLRRAWFAYSGWLIALGAFHIVALCALAAHAVFAWMLPVPERNMARRPFFARYLASVAVALIVLAPLVFMGARQAFQISWIRADVSSLFAFPSALFSSEVLAGMLMCAGLLGLGRAGSRAPLLAVWALFPPLFFFVTFDLLHLFLPRYMLFTLPAWVLLAASAFTQNSAAPRLLRVVPALLLVAVFSWHAQGPIRERTPEGYYDYKTAALAIAKEAQPGDAITFEGPRAGTAHIRMAFLYILRHKPKLLRDVFALGPSSQLGSFLPELCPDAAACVGPDVKRLWLVTTASARNLFDEMGEDRTRLLDSAFELTEVHSVPKLRYALFTRRAVPAPGTGELPPPR
jgi:mannosyltransferase